MQKNFQTKTMILNGKKVKILVPRKLTEEERKQKLKEMEKLFRELVSAR